MKAFEERLLKERDELGEKILKLKEFIIHLPVPLSALQGTLLVQQLSHMEAYMSTLQMRILDLISNPR